MSKPIIGITADVFADKDPIMGPQYRLRENYCRCIAEAGGVPILIPLVADIEAIAPLLDGWLIAGGLDLDAQFYVAEPDPNGESQDPRRYLAERRLFQSLPSSAPILGICYGCQFLNVVQGGTLVGHLPDRVGHQQHEGGTLSSSAIIPGTKLASIMLEDLVEGRSYHHQAVDRLGEGLRVAAHHEDGTVEALESTDGRWLVGVQWHPERTPDGVHSKRLFDAFIRASEQFRAQRGAA